MFILCLLSRIKNLLSKMHFFFLSQPYSHFFEFRALGFVIVLSADRGSDVTA